MINRIKRIHQNAENRYIGINLIAFQHIPNKSFVFFPEENLIFPPVYSLFIIPNEINSMSLFVKKPIDKLILEADDTEKGLKRTLGAGNLIALGIGAIIGAGLFVRTAAAAAQSAGAGAVRKPARLREGDGRGLLRGEAQIALPRLGGGVC